MFIKNFAVLCVMGSVVSAIQFSAFAAPNQSAAATSSNDAAAKKAEVEHQKMRSSLFGAMEDLLQNNKELLAMQRELKAVHESRVGVIAAFRPTVALVARYRGAENKEWKYDVAPRVDRTSEKSYGLEVKQNLYRGRSDLAAKKEIDLAIRARWHQYERKKQELLRDLAILYAALIAKKEEITHLKALLANRKESVEVAKEMYETGAVKPLDLEQANAACLETEAKLAKAEAEFVAHCTKFEEMTGKPIPVNLVVPDKMFDELITDDQAVLIALEENPEVISANYAVLSAKEAIKKPNPEFTPTVDLILGMEKSRDSGHKHEIQNQTQRTGYSRRGVTMTLNATVPIYDGGTGRAEKRRAVENSEKAAVDKAHAIEKIRTEVSAVLAALKAAKQNLVFAVKAVEMRVLALHDTQEEYKAGIKIMNDVLEAQWHLFEAKHIAVQAAEQYFVSQCRALALIGRMTPKYLKITDYDFDYIRHYEKTKNRF
ncbi:MAG: TolC family protein [Holosporales bacterium]|jgi:outer membrane protein|nr:TolC family protein [Holosporales bacterium]